MRLIYRQNLRCGNIQGGNRLYKHGPKWVVKVSLKNMKLCHFLAILTARYRSWLWQMRPVWTLFIRAIHIKKSRNPSLSNLRTCLIKTLVISCINCVAYTEILLCRQTWLFKSVTWQISVNIYMFSKCAQPRTLQNVELELLFHHDLNLSKCCSFVYNRQVCSGAVLKNGVEKRCLFYCRANKRSQAFGIYKHSHYNKFLYTRHTW